MSLIENLKQNLIAERDRAKKRRVFIKADVEIFKQLFLLNANIELAKRNRRIDFVIDEENKEVINQLYFYSIGSEKFTGDLYKGIMLVGNLGTGKTLIMSAFLNIIESGSNKIITRFHSKEVPLKLKEKESDPDFYKTRPIFIDDVGKEPSMINNYGTKTSPISDLFALRYDFGSWTFTTTNHTGKELLEKYGGSTVDRFKEMFNIINLTGNSRR